jgi:hypothetical protein
MIKVKVRPDGVVEYFDGSRWFSFDPRTNTGDVEAQRWVRTIQFYALTPGTYSLQNGTFVKEGEQQASVPGATTPASSPTGVSAPTSGVQGVSAPGATTPTSTIAAPSPTATNTAPYGVKAIKWASGKVDFWGGSGKWESYDPNLTGSSVVLNSPEAQAIAGVLANQPPGEYDYIRGNWELSGSPISGVLAPENRPGGTANTPARVTTTPAPVTPTPTSPPPVTGVTPPPPGAGVTGDGVVPPGSPPPIDIQPGLDALQWEAELALGYAALKNQREIAEIQDTTDRYIADLNYKLGIGQIDQQEKDRLQNEAQFARDLALRTRQQGHQEELDAIYAELDTRRIEVEEGRLDIDRAAQILSERLAHAELSANPRDWIAYQIFVRSGGGVSGEEAVAKAEEVSASLNQGATTQGELLSGLELPPPAPAYSPEVLQRATSLAGSPVSPSALQGTGQFGANIPAPNLSRRNFNLLTPTQISQLTGSILGGFQVGDRFIAGNPEDYFNVQQRGFIPSGI